MKLIDFETHFYDTCVLDYFSKNTTYPKYDKETNNITWREGLVQPQGVMLARLMDIGATRIADMDKHGVDAAVISCSPGVEDLEPKDSIPLCREINDCVANLCKTYPGRYFGSAVLPVHDAEAACAELTRCVKELGFVCWHTHSNYGETSVDFPEYRDILRAACDLGVYVYLHPQIPVTSRLEDCGFPVMAGGIGFTQDTLTTMSRMILFGVFDELPELQVLLGHLGEGIPFLMKRMEKCFTLPSDVKHKMGKPFGYYFKHNVMVTTSGNMCPEAFACVKNTMGIDRILYGSDYPFEQNSEMIEFVENLPLGKAERELLYYKTGETLGVCL